MFWSKPAGKNKCFFVTIPTNQYLTLRCTSSHAQIQLLSPRYLCVHLASPNSCAAQLPILTPPNSLQNKYTDSESIQPPDSGTVNAYRNKETEPSKHTPSWENKQVPRPDKPTSHMRCSHSPYGRDRAADPASTWGCSGCSPTPDLFAGLGGGLRGRFVLGARSSAASRWRCRTALAATAPLRTAVLEGARQQQGEAPAAGNEKRPLPCN